LSQCAGRNTPRCPGLSHHGNCLLQAARLAQAGANELAERTLSTALLSAAGAEFCLGPLEGLARLLAQARLYFRRRSWPTRNFRTVAS